MRTFNQIEVAVEGDVFYICLRVPRLDEQDLNEFETEIIQLYNQEGARKMVLDLGQENIFCLYSLFLAKLVRVQHKLRKARGKLVLANVSPEVMQIFQVCGLDKVFLFFPDRQTAVQSLSGTKGSGEIHANGR